ncbi:MAG TPA: hypothetical protein VIW80_00800 [Pyrinomonadaceae bacterium]|jgi:hypothetical protein
MLDKLHLETFSEHLNSKFSVRREPSADAVELQLIEAESTGTVPGYEQFSLIFSGPLNSFLEQAIYSFEHDGIGTFEMFIVPIRRDENGFKYQAIINRPL